jgi:hypothetical protein
MFLVEGGGSPKRWGHEIENGNPFRCGNEGDVEVVSVFRIYLENKSRKNGRMRVKRSEVPVMGGKQ